MRNGILLEAFFYQSQNAVPGTNPPRQTEALNLLQSKQCARTCLVTTAVLVQFPCFLHVYEYLLIFDYGSFRVLARMQTFDLLENASLLYYQAP